MVEEVTERNFDEYVGLFKKMFNLAENAREECLNLWKGKKEYPFLYVRDGEYLGYLGLSIRSDYVNGTDGSPVVFVEAVYVETFARRAGIGRELLNFARAFARARGIAQVASDCVSDNKTSEQFHKACGFDETERVIFFLSPAERE